MKYEESYFNGKDGTSRFFRTWSPDTEPRGIVVISHGYAEHSGRYEALAGRLLAENFAVWAHDHYGHGRSEGTRALINRIELAAEDLAKAMETAYALYNEKPLFLYGHSMGGAVAALTAVGNRKLPSGIIFSAAAVRIMHTSPALVRAAAHLIRLFSPSLPLIPFNIEYLSKSAEVKEAYRNDPLTYTGKMKVAMALEMAEAEKMLSPEALSKIKVPALIMHGGEDKTVPPESSRQLYKLIGSENKTLHFFENAYHEIHNEECAEELYGLVIGWLRQFSL
ncbi:MAG: lysophospholipase [Spirochaetaceae bacterium]